MPKDSKAWVQSLELQALAMKTANTLSKDLQFTPDKELRTKQAQALAAVIRAYDTIEERKRILKGKPMPGSLRPESKTKRKTQKHTAPLEIVEFKEKESLNQPDQPKEEGVGGGTGGPAQ